MPFYFLGAFIFLLSGISLSRTLLVFISLHALRCFIFCSQMPKTEARGALIDFFIFPDPYVGY